MARKKSECRKSTYSSECRKSGLVRDDSDDSDTHGAHGTHVENESACNLTSTAVTDHKWFMSCETEGLEEDIRNTRVQLSRAQKTIKKQRDTIQKQHDAIDKMKKHLYRAVDILSSHPTTFEACAEPESAPEVQTLTHVSSELATATAAGVMIAGGSVALALTLAAFVGISSSTASARSRRDVGGESVGVGAGAGAGVSGTVCTV